MLRMPRCSCTSILGVLSSSTSGQTILTLPYLLPYRTVPTHDQILVPETLLKKRKSQEKQREERSAELDEKRKVRLPPVNPQTNTRKGEICWGDGDDNYQPCD